MPTPPTPDDPRGLAHEARADPGRGLCLLMALNDELLAQGITGRSRDCWSSGHCQTLGFVVHYNWVQSDQPEPGLFAPR